MYVFFTAATFKIVPKMGSQYFIFLFNLFKFYITFNFEGTDDMLRVRVKLI